MATNGIEKNQILSIFTRPFVNQTTAQLHPNLLIAAMQLWQWLFFTPQQWDKYITQIDEQLLPDFALSELTATHWQQLSKILGLIYFWLPLFSVCFVACSLFVLNVPWLHIARASMYSFIIVFIGNLMLGLMVSVIYGFVISHIIGLSVGLFFCLGICVLPNDATLWKHLSISSSFFAMAYVVYLSTQFYQFKLNSPFWGNVFISIFIVLFLTVVSGVLWVGFQTIPWLFNFTGLEKIHLQIIGLSIVIAAITAFLLRSWLWAILFSSLLGFFIFIAVNIKITENGSIINSFTGSLLNTAIFVACYTLSYLMTYHLANPKAATISGLLGVAVYYIGFYLYHNPSAYMLVTYCGIAILCGFYLPQMNLAQTKKILIQGILSINQFIHPEKLYLLSHLQTWRNLIHDTAQKVMIATSPEQKADNPYIIGVPLNLNSESMFVGRQDIIQKVEQLLQNQQHAPIMLYGQRRIGKTSLLIQFNNKLPEQYIPLFINFQKFSLVKSSIEFLYMLGHEICHSAKKHRNIQFPKLERQQLASEPMITFDNWLDELESIVGQNTLFLTFDEFESLENSFNRGKLDQDEVLSLLRTLIQEHDKIKVLIAGAYLLEEFSGWQNYLVNVEMVYLGYLTKREAVQLAGKSNSIQYEPDALQHISYLTHNHPALIQLICKELINQLNFSPSTHLRRKVNLNDIEHAANEALKTGRALFSHATHPSHYSDIELKLLKLLAQDQEWVSRNEILKAISVDDLDIALTRLQQRQLIKISADQHYFQFEIELIRRWFA
ncbi:ATP-binding protein [Candidatus Albibeggiatoa sp. nov. BB20]|uniref:ATP-binding protein n=1 Tax=Candidatus Albibeggiatoa sp. nov. BB20 TaxID=3162723 RepID=UPI003365775A